MTAINRKQIEDLTKQELDSIYQMYSVVGKRQDHIAKIIGTSQKTLKKVLKETLWARSPEYRNQVKATIAATIEKRNALGYTPDNERKDTWPAGTNFAAPGRHYHSLDTPDSLYCPIRC